jgi:hypothetical protein
MDMPPDDSRLTEVSGPDPDAMITENAPWEIPANQHDADQLDDHVRWALVDAEQQVDEPQTHDGGSTAAAPARSLRRATARRASNRRATARSRQSDNEASIIKFLARHPGSTAGDLAKGLNLNPGNVATRLTQLSKAGEIKRASHGYSTRQATQGY